MLHDTTTTLETVVSLVRTPAVTLEFTFTRDFPSVDPPEEGAALPNAFSMMMQQSRRASHREARLHVMKIPKTVLRIFSTNC